MSQDTHALLLEALVFAAEQPITRKFLQEKLGWSQQEVDQAKTSLAEALTHRAVELVEGATGFQIRIKAGFAAEIFALWPERSHKLSQALLETLSIIAYKQPVTRAEIESIRGVSVSSGVLRQLFDKGWICERGFKDSAGKPALLHTTSAFLDAFDLKSLAELPPLPELAPLDLEDAP